jgi:hypothetical protein
VSNAIVKYPVRFNDVDIIEGNDHISRYHYRNGGPIQCGKIAADKRCSWMQSFNDVIIQDVLKELNVFRKEERFQGYPCWKAGRKSVP